MTPLQLYHQAIEKGELEKNDAQQVVAQKLDFIYHNLIKRQKQRASTYGKVRRKIKPRAPIKGLYLWGGVGVGKTWLVDNFYQCLTIKKMRIHFHSFMRDIHQQLTTLQGTKNPLQIIAKSIADNHIVICFDEFFVSNIADAMILAELFEYLFAGGICLIATSNVSPDELYKNGLQRERFMPTIDLIKKYTDIVQLVIDKDYRYRHIEKAGVYYTPLNHAAERNMEKAFSAFSKNETYSTEPIQISNRTFNIIKQADDTVWFDFHELCALPRAPQDYLAIAKNYQYILISNIPAISAKNSDIALRFINLIDILYDQHVRVAISASTEIHQIYTEGRVSFEFERTKSRLIEMQSADYLASK